MASPKKSFKDGFTIASLIGGSDSGPGSSTGKGAGYGGAPTLTPINSGEKVTTNDTGDKDIYPPVYGGGERQITVTKKKRRGAGGGGYVPSTSDKSNAPKAI